MEDVRAQLNLVVGSTTTPEESLPNSTRGEELVAEVHPSWADVLARAPTIASSASWPARRAQNFIDFVETPCASLPCGGGSSPSCPPRLKELEPVQRWT